MGNHPTQHPEAVRRRFWFKVWVTAFGTLGAVDVWRMTKHDDSTLSATIRRTFHTDTPEGKALFLSALVLLARHILHQREYQKTPG